MTLQEIDTARTTAEPEPKIPDDMLDFFTYGKRLTVQPWVLNAMYLGDGSQLGRPSGPGEQANA